MLNILNKTCTTKTLVMVLWGICSLSNFSNASKFYLDKQTQNLNSHNLIAPRLRGAMVGINLGKEDIIEFGRDWKANHIRWQLLWEPIGDVSDLQQYNQWLDSQLDKLDRILPIAQQVGIKIVLDLHTLPGGRAENEQSQLFSELKYQKQFIQVWKKIAQRYKDNKTIWAYDLANEPVQGTLKAGLETWYDLATTTAKKIRSVDVSHAIIFEPSPWANPEGFNNLKPLKVPGIVYSFHMYLPHSFTHQGIDDFGPLGIHYPGKIDGEYWNKNKLIEKLQPVLHFQSKYQVAIYVGEFSALRWAPGDSSYQYLKDCIEIFESFGWSWAYHAFREWDGWSVEHSSDRMDKNKTNIPTAREKLLQNWYKMNK